MGPIYDRPSGLQGFQCERDLEQLFIAPIAAESLGLGMTGYRHRAGICWEGGVRQLSPFLSQEPDSVQLEDVMAYAKRATDGAKVRGIQPD